MFNRLQDANDGHRKVERKPTVEPIPLRTRALLLGGIILGAAAVYLGNLGYEIVNSEVPPQSADTEEHVRYLEKDLHDKTELAIGSLVFAAGTTLFVGGMLLDKDLK